MDGTEIYIYLVTGIFRPAGLSYSLIAFRDMQVGIGIRRHHIAYYLWLQYDSSFMMNSYYRSWSMLSLEYEAHI